MKEKEIKNDPQISGKFMMKSLNDREFTKRRCRETTDCTVDVVSDMRITYAVEMSSTQRERWL